ncbi:MAG TPA: dihydropteroate synthase [Actinomycetota bacterium]|nr:dihydropteroate synthase [Actinomycetota bacterium]
MDRLLWRCGPQTIDCAERTRVMGVLNVTPDSFSDGGRFFDPEAGVTRGVEMAAQGADFLDVGGESTRPGSETVPEEEERRRVIPVIKRLVAELDIPISIDTRKPAVAAAALEVGATIVNDVTAGADPRTFEVAREAGAGLVLMHMRGEPATMQQLTDYQDVVTDVRDYLSQRVEAAVAAGLDRELLCVDPGLGFAKTEEQSLRLIRETDAFLSIGRPVLVGPSRKSFIGWALDLPVDERVEGTMAAVVFAVARGAHIVRVHDVKEAARAVRVTDAILRA